MRRSLIRIIGIFLLRGFYTENLLKDLKKAKNLITDT